MSTPEPPRDVDPGALGLDRASVRVVPHHPAWAALFAEEAARLRSALGSAVIDIEHIGSTSVPGLAAKPILDLSASVPSLADEVRLIPALERLGYQHKADPDIPERLYFVKGPPERRTHHLSLAEPGSRFWREHLRFRDLLRADPVLAAEYARLKHDLAARHACDRLAYTTGKKSFIDAAVRQSNEDGG
ncbi:MAG TPA: GrpB family protein [Longimicrobium sp.]|nr:GrpB family protein [Longimicrobium sp.]